MKTAIFSSNKTFGGRNISKKKKSLFGKASLLKVLNLYFHSVNYNILKYIDYNI